ncbi:glycosyl transferase group 1 [Pseudodesulfovibrio mercurii]|uniref:Glycosyl transferase group 1 n=1 Tax=Pseudodesulfovibrio mercurii TaxID=641491 RepID=F0JDZ0_9BACT|nr:glycosyltransferase [Pseudodesulfovibrio mercurii]EGB13430.1 glycosyl transferase group 1 [Pseudodesulfovibrio mercurii]
MRILHISKFSHPERGGIESFVRDLTTEQARQGHDVAVLCHQAHPWRATERSVSEGVVSVQARILCNVGFAPVSPLFPLHLRRLVREKRPEIIHLHLPNPAALYSGWFPADIPLVIHWHADADGLPGRLYRSLYPVYGLFEAKCLSLADSVIATSPAYAASSRSLAHLRDKCVVVPLGLDLARYPEDAQLSRTQEPTILSVGRFAYYKGYETLVEAARMVPAARFVIVGDGPLHGKISSMIRERGLADRVRLPGSLPDRELRVLLQLATLVCLPSVDRAEAFGLVQLEAMRYGVPLVSTAIPGSGVDWVNQDGVTGLVVPPGNAEALAHALQWVVDHEQTAEAMGKAGRLRLESHFTIERVTSALDNVYARVRGLSG